MSTTFEDLQSFHEFAAARLASGDDATSLDELLMEWHDRRSRNEINEAIRQGLADVEAGGVQDADEFNESLRQELC